ncbi:MAG: HEAT repeat domain-containing protein, partial [Bryobacter sp.]|nr:HEAT repeat domain-containing protein [Bryobacter sp.]
SFLRSGGGLVANHAATVTNTSWEEFGFLLGARGAMHRESDEKVTIQLDDAASPLNAPFAGKNLTFSDEFFRFTHPYSRARVRVLQSFDVAKTDMNQGRSYGAVTRLDGDYPVSWVRSEGKGRVLYTTFGHGPSAFWNPQVLAFFLAALQFACGDLEANTTPDLDAAARSFENLLSAVPAYDFGKERKVIEEAGRVVTDSVTVPAWRARVERSLLAMLARPGLSLGAKDFLCRQLSVAGSAASVPALAAMLRQPETVEMARYAMERIPGAEADKALRDVLASGAKAGRIGIINSIGVRADAQAVALLTPLLKAEDAGVGAAAAHALGRIATPAACRAVEQAAPAAPELRRAVLSARLDCAAKTAATNRAAAAKSYAALLANSAEPPVRVAALRGLAATSPAEAAKEAAGALGRDDAVLRAAAVQLLAAQEPKTLLDRFDTLPAPAQAQAITAFATRGWKPAAPAVTRSVSSGAPEVQLAAVRALPLVGDPGAVPVLARIAAESEGAVQEAARDGLARMPGEAIDAAVVAGIGSATGSMKVELIRAAGARASASAVPVLLAAARDSDASIRREAMRSLRTAAAPGDTRGLIALVVSAPNATDRREAEQALVASLRRWEKPPVSELIAAYRGDASPDARASLLMAMSLTGAPEGLPVLREALAANDAALRRAAILALTEWPSADPAADLLAVARQGGATSHAVLALRGYVKLIGLPSSRPRPETARLASEALRAASRPEEKKLALAVLAQAPCAESLALAEAAAADPAVAAEARLAAETIKKVMNSERR